MKCALKVEKEIYISERQEKTSRLMILKGTLIQY